VKGTLICFLNHFISCTAKGKGIYRVTIGIGDDITNEELEKIPGGKEETIKLGSFAQMLGKTTDIRNITCSQSTFLEIVACLNI